MKKFKLWMFWHIRLWQIFNPTRVKLFEYSISQGFDQYSSYWSARCASEDLIKFILEKK